MKSYINSLADYRQAPFEKEVAIECPEEFIQGQMKHLTRGSKKTVASEVLEKGDVVVLSLESNLEKFNRPAVFLTVGSNLFDADFESGLIGHKSGESFDITVQGETVKVTVKQATRTVYPEPTDEMAEAYAKEDNEYEGVKTVEDYRRQVVKKYIMDKRNDAIYGAMEVILNYVLTHTDWEFDNEELEKLIAEDKGYIEQELKEDGKTMSDLSDEELNNFFGIESIEDFDKFLKDGAEQQIATTLWLAHMHGIDAKTASAEEINECSWDFLEDYVKENVKITEVK